MELPSSSSPLNKKLSFQPPPPQLPLYSISSENDSSERNLLLPSACHGKVKEEDFERMVPPQWWKTVFADEIYLKTDGDVVEDPNITKEEIRMLETDPEVKALFHTGILSEANHGAKILDLCCGQGRHSLCLSENYPALCVYGHDQSAFLVSLARERALILPPCPNRSSPPIFTVGDCRSVPYETNMFDLTMVMGNSFGYFGVNETLSDNEIDSDRAVLLEINRVLKKDGILILDLADGDYLRQNYSQRSWEWIDNQTFVCRERVLSNDAKRLHSREVVVSVTRGVLRDQFYSERLYSRQEMFNMLEESGFCIENVPTSRNETVTAAREMSQRGQDLGMMEQRLVLIAKKKSSTSNNETLEMVRSCSNHPFLSDESVQLVREWMEKLPSKLTQDDILSYSSQFSNDYQKILKLWLKSLKMELEPLQKKSLNQNSQEYFIQPSFYHLLPPPPFPGEKFAILMGDTSLQCREKLHGVWNPEDLETRRHLINAILACGYTSQQLKIIDNHRELVALFSQQDPLFILNICDEGYMNDANKELHVPALMEMCHFPYSGAGPVSLGICYDKGFVNSTAGNLDIPTPRETYIIFPETVDLKELRFDDIYRLVRSKELKNEIHYPCFIKPMKGDNSLGITGRSISHNCNDLITYVEYLIQTYGLREFILQEYLMGTEYSVGMIGNPETGFHFLPILQVDYSKILKEGLEPILGWESKWDPTSAYWTDIGYTIAPRIPLRESENHSIVGGLTEDEEELLKRNCATLFERFGCRDYARFDWRADHDNNFLLIHEDNSNNVDSNNFNLRAPTKSMNNESEESFSTGSEKVERFTDESSEEDQSLNDSGRGSLKYCEDTSNVIIAENISKNNVPSPTRSIKLLEVNPNPGWCWDGKLAKMMAFEGKTYSEMIKVILWTAWFRIYGSQLENKQ